MLSKKFDVFLSSATRIIRPQRVYLTFCATLAAANLLLLLGWKAVPRDTMYVGGIPVANLTLCAPVSKHQETTASKDSSNALVRSILKQSLYFPYDFMGKQGRVRSMQELGVDIKHDATNLDAILIFGDDQIQWDLARFAERTVVGISSANATGVAAFFEQQDEPLDVMVVVPNGAAAEATDFFERAFERTRFHVREVEVFQQVLTNP